MGLKKDIIFDNGVNIQYHYINDIQIDGKNKIVKLKVDSYTDESYRLKEKENLNNKNKYNDIMEFIIQENSKQEEDRDIEKIKQLSDEANDLVENIIENLDLKVISLNFEFKEIVDYNLSNLYKILKSIELFENSEDV